MPSLDCRAIRGAFALAGWLCALPVEAPSAQVRTRVPAVVRGDVTYFTVSPDSTHVLYFADPNVDDAFEVFCVPVAGGPAVRVTHPPVAGGDVTAAAFFPDARSVLFLGDVETDDVFELWAGSIDGEPPRKLNQPLVAGGDVASYAFAADSGRVLFSADAEHDGTVELYSVALAGGAVVRLGPRSSPGTNVTWFRAIPGTERVAMCVRVGTGMPQLYSDALTGGDPVLLSSNLGPGDWVDETSLELGASKQVAFNARIGPVSMSGPFLVPAGGGTPLELRDPALDHLRSFGVHPDGTSVFYLAAQGGYPIELYSVPTAGGHSRRVNGDLGGGEHVWGFWFAPDGQWMLYGVERSDVSVALYSISPRGEPIELVRPGNGEVLGGWITPDSKRVLLSLVLPGTAASSELWSIPIDGGTAVPLVNGHEFVSWAVSLDSKHLVWVADSPATGLFRVSLDGGPIERLTPRLVRGGAVQNMRLTPDGRFIVYCADQDRDDVVELYRIPLEGGASVQLSPEFPAGP